jgi:hypothetical protein
LGKNASLELHSLVYCERHTGIDHLWVKVKSYTSCLYSRLERPMLKWLSTLLVVVSQWLSLQFTGVLEMFSTYQGRPFGQDQLFVTGLRPGIHGS